jgi:DNA-binding transcriptional ArsR family regulator
LHIVDEFMSAPVFAALADGTRNAILVAVARHGPMTATELLDHVAVSRQAITKHLSILRDAGLVTAAKAGRDVRYRAQAAGLRSTAQALREIAAGAEQSTAGRFVAGLRPTLLCSVQTVDDMDRAIGGWLDLGLRTMWFPSEGVCLLGADRLVVLLADRADERALGPGPLLAIAHIDRLTQHWLAVPRETSMGRYAVATAPGGTVVRVIEPNTQLRELLGRK